jgi:hypothetical protein
MPPAGRHLPPPAARRCCALARLLRASDPRRPHPQALSLPALANGGSYLLASHTGSGKTLSYLLPVVQRLKLQEQQQQVSGAVAPICRPPFGTQLAPAPHRWPRTPAPNAQVVARPKRPRALILGPTKELAEQIFRVAKGLAHHAKLRTTCVTSAGVWKSQREALSGPIDLVVATPTKLLMHLQVGAARPAGCLPSGCHPAACSQALVARRPNFEAAGLFASPACAPCSPALPVPPGPPAGGQPAPGRRDLAGGGRGGHHV